MKMMCQYKAHSIFKAFLCLRVGLEYAWKTISRTRMMYYFLRGTIYCQGLGSNCYLLWFIENPSVPVAPLKKRLRNILVTSSGE